MQVLAEAYSQQLENIKSAIQESEELSTFLDSEESEDYNALKAIYEPEIAQLYEQIANEAPLQLEALEMALLDESLEGLYLGKILGYATLRPRVSERGQYYRPQEHLRQVLLAIASNSSFDELEKRLGQGVTTALFLSTNVWVTNLVADISSKQARNFYTNHHDTTLRTPELRLAAYKRYYRQFAKDNYATATFPTTVSEAAVLYDDLEAFLRYRFGNELDNSSLAEPIKAMLENKELESTPQYERFIGLVGMFMPLPDKMENDIRKRIRKLAENPEFADRYFSLLAELHQDKSITVSPEADKRMALRVGMTDKNLVSSYYALVTKIHENGIEDLETLDAIRLFMQEEDGLSDVAECVRQTVLRYFTDIISALNVEKYSAFFEATKLFAIHFSIFGNESFKQELRTQSLNYVKQLLKRYTDKRGRDYQDIKKFVRTTFNDLGFMSEKEIVNFFKTKRKRKPSEMA